MTKEQMLSKLNDDLSNEYMHMLFYLHSSATITGLHRAELGELLLAHAQSEMSHVREFADLIIGLGGNLNYTYKKFPYMWMPDDIFRHAIHIEDEVVKNYHDRILDSEKLSGVDGKYIELFMERQLEDSRKDADEFRQMIVTSEDIKFRIASQNCCLGLNLKEE